MRTARFLLIVLALLMIPIAASAAPASAVTAPTLDAFLSSLNHTAAPLAKAANSCGSNFCTTAERTACSQQCLSHHHGPFVGLECCTGSCTTLCICGSVPVGC